MRTSGGETFRGRRTKASRSGQRRVAAGEGDELDHGAGVGWHRHTRIESCSGATLRIQGLPPKAEDVGSVTASGTWM